MTLKNDLSAYFSDNPDQATEAFHEGHFGLWGYQGYPDKDIYHVSDFEMWATDNGVDKPETVEDFGGEDMGSNYYKVVKFTRGDETVFIKFQGWYASYDGSYYEGWGFVTPKEVVKVEYV